MNNLHSIIDKCGNNTAYHPASTQCSDDEQNDNGCSNPRNIVRYGKFIIFPWNAVESHSYKYTDSSGYQQGNLTTAV